MKNIALFILVFGLLIPACKKGPIASIRNPNVYAAEIDYNSMVQNQAVKHLHYWMQENCTCDADGLWEGDHADACEKTAKHILVVVTRQPWHNAMMEYNGSLIEERPSEVGPEIPETSTLCVEKTAPESEAPVPEGDSEGG